MKVVIIYFYDAALKLVLVLKISLKITCEQKLKQINQIYLLILIYLLYKGVLKLSLYNDPEIERVIRFFI